MSKKKKYSMQFKQLSDIPQGAIMNPANHVSDNLAVRGQVPLGQSGEQMMSPILDETHKDGGSSTTGLPKGQM